MQAPGGKGREAGDESSLMTGLLLACIETSWTYVVDTAVVAVRDGGMK